MRAIALYVSYSALALGTLASKRAIRNASAAVKGNADAGRYLTCYRA